MSKIEFLTMRQILRIHDKVLAEYDGGMSGVRDMGLLESAVMMPQTTFGDEYLSGDIFGMAATYAFGIIKNHAFIDGNKRTGISCAGVFLDVNGIALKITDTQLYDIAIAVATSKISIEQLAQFFREHAEYYE